MSSDPKRDSHSTNSLLIGVDAGGSKTLAWVENAATVQQAMFNRHESFQHADSIAAGISGPGNVRAVGFESATDSIAQAIDAALADYRIKNNLDDQNSPLKICLSAAGAGRDAEKRQLHTWACERFPMAQVLITDDANPVLAAVSDDRIGVALICGTGAFAWGRNHNGEMQRCGGWGYLFGDEGSGYTIGIEALRAISRASDGRGAATELVENCCRYLQINGPEQLIPVVYGQSMSRAEIAKLAPIVFAAWETDPVANQILQNAADENALLINTIAKQLSFHDGLPSLALAGGVLVQQPKFREEVIRRIDLRIDHLEVVPNPVFGAMKMAAQHPLN